MADAKVAALFDFDKTLLLKESAALGFRAMWDDGRVSAGFLLKLTLADQLYKRGWMSAEKIAALCLRYYCGRKLDWYVANAPDFYAKWLKPNLSPAMLAKVEEHRAQGHRLVLLSASVDYFLKVAAAELRFDRLLCTQLERDENGVCTGRPLGAVVVGAQKKVVAEEFARAEGVDLAASYAYADHISDVPLLTAVGHPVAVHPVKALRRVAQERGWPIIDAD